MENNKITLSLTTVIVICVVIVALVFGIAGLLVYFNMVDTNNISASQTTETLEEIEDVKEVEVSTNVKEDTTISNNSSTVSDSDDSNVSSNESTTTTNKENSNTAESSTTTKTSSKQNPLSIGEWGLASKYFSGEYTDVPIKVTNITRGNAATQLIKNYCNEHTIYKYSEPKDGLEWAVIDYTVDLTKVEAKSYGRSIQVDSKIRGTGDNTSVKYNGYTYILTTKDMSESSTKDNIANGSFAVQLPIGCTEYVIVMGSSSHTQAFFAGK